MSSLKMILYCAGFQSILKNFYKIYLVLFSPEYAPFLGLRDRKCPNFSCYRLLLENAISNVNYSI